MLRIMLKFQTPEEVVLEVDGWVMEEEVELLDQEIARWHGQAKQLILDLGGVKFIDESGLALLKRWAARQLALRGGSAFVRMLLKSYGLA